MIFHCLRKIFGIFQSNLKNSPNINYFTDLCMFELCMQVNVRKRLFRNLINMVAFNDFKK